MLEMLGGGVLRWTLATHVLAQYVSGTAAEERSEALSGGWGPHHAVAIHKRVEQICGSQTYMEGGRRTVIPALILRWMRSHGRWSTALR
jgi:hypothetical protein